MKKTLLEMFCMNENALKPEQEKIVDEFFEKIMAATGASHGGNEEAVKDVLRDMLRASEGAEGEDPREIEVGFDDVE